MMQKMEGARGKVDSDVVLESTGPRLYGSVFKEFAPQAEPLGTSFVGKWQARSSSSPVHAVTSSTPAYTTRAAGLGHCTSGVQALSALLSLMLVVTRTLSVSLGDLTSWKEAKS